MTIKLDSLYRIDAPGHTHHERLVRTVGEIGTQIAVECVTDGQRLTCCQSELCYVGPCQVVGPRKELDE